jgi:hypothetical protein
MSKRQLAPSVDGNNVLSRSDGLPALHEGDRRTRSRRWLLAFGLVALVTPRGAAAQPALACGQTQNGTIAALGEQHQFTVPGDAGDVVAVTVVETSAIDPTFDPFVTLVGPGGPKFLTAGVGFFTLPATATYGIVVRAIQDNARGSYTLKFDRVLPLSKQCGDRTPLACGQEMEGSIGDPLELDLFNFDGPQGATVNLTLVELADIDVGFQVHGELFGPNGAALGFVGTGQTRSVTLPATGNYALAVYDLATSRRRGTYLARLASPGPCPPPQMPPVLGLGLNGAAFPPGATMTLTGTLSAGNVPGAVDAYVVLQLPSGQFFSLQLGGGLVPGVVPIARGFGPIDFQGVLAQYTFTGAEPPGIYTWISALTAPGTLNLVSPLQQVAFTVP